jgi:D-sedoheptulose 7-phosphate isomerase
MNITKVESEQSSRQAGVEHTAPLRIEQNIRKYIDEVQDVLGRIPVDDIRRVIDRLILAYVQDAQIFTLGNGGSAATASHFANDLNKAASCDGRRRFRAIALTDNVPLLTAWGNDLSYDDIFVEQLKNLYRDNAVVIGISGSGNSENVLRALRFAKSRGGTTIGFTGYQGGEIKHIASASIVVPSDSMQQIEDAHLVLEHLICTVLRQEVSCL